MPEKNKTMSGRLRLLILVLIPLGILYTCAGIWSTQNIIKTSVQYTSGLIDVYIDDIDDKIENINRRLGIMFLGETDSGQDVNVYLEKIRRTDNEAYRNYYISHLKRTFASYAMEYGEGYHFFAYFPENGWYIENYGDELSVRTLWDYEAAVKSYFDEEKPSKAYGSQYWKVYEDPNGKVCVLKYYKMKHNYIGCWIRPEDLILPLQEVVQDGGGSIFLYDRDGQLFAGIGEKAGHISEETILENKHNVIEKVFRNMPFYICFATTNNGMFGAVLTTQMIMMAIAMGMLALVISCVAYLYQKVLIPVRMFTHNLEIIKKGEGNLENISSSQLKELKDANMELSSLLRQINLLEKEIQQQELEKQGMYLDYLKLQIRPHFYLNCLNFIYNMIDLEKWEAAQKMARCTADYMRYLLKDDLEFVYLWEELEHVENYAQIQKLRFGEGFHYYIDAEMETKQAQVPHMMIQPFVENCIKYAMDPAHKINITITIYGETVNAEPYVNICISDTGPGFSKELLEALNKAGELDKINEMGIGIVNTIKRLNYYYQGRGKITFTNGPGRGAIIDIHIPNLQNRP